MAKAPAKPPQPALRLEWIEAGSLAENPSNWRRHSQEQLSSLRSLIEDPAIGWAGVCLLNERTGRLVDGHARRSVVSPSTLVPVLIGNWSEEAEKKILLTLDPVAMMAEADAEQLRALLDDVNLDGALQPIDDLLESLADSEGEASATVRPLDIKPPPKTTWVLIGIPTVRYGEIAEAVEGIAAVAGTIVESTSNDADIKN